ncbi:hypothetical protein LTR17_000968 [Elasticomyces elasticus]|nr:hypothetical protein LTR17_000968 [Elasticomyces elasticus]
MRYALVLMAAAHFTGATVAAPEAYAAPADLSVRGAKGDALPGFQGNEVPEVKRWISDDDPNGGSVDGQFKRQAKKLLVVAKSGEPDFVSGWDTDAVGTPDETS